MPESFDDLPPGFVIEGSAESFDDLPPGFVVETTPAAPAASGGGFQQMLDQMIGGTAQASDAPAPAVAPRASNEDAFQRVIGEVIGGTLGAAAGAAGGPPGAIAGAGVGTATGGELATRGVRDPGDPSQGFRPNVPAGATPGDPLRTQVPRGPGFDALPDPNAITGPRPDVRTGAEVAADAALAATAGAAGQGIGMPIGQALKAASKFLLRTQLPKAAKPALRAVKNARATAKATPAPKSAADFLDNKFTAAEIAKHRRAVQAAAKAEVAEGLVSNIFGPGLFKGGSGAAVGSVLGMAAGDPLTLGVLGSAWGVTQLAARQVLLRNPRFIDWVTSTTLPSGNSLPAHLVRLGEVLANETAETRLAAMEFLSNLDEEQAP